ncbi:MAG TPA: ABC transporter ATP-binding protein [Polyangiaceae bacterium]
MSKAFLRLSEVTKAFGAKVALAGVDLTLGEDELLIVLGPSGAGKTTLLRTIAGLEDPTSGVIEMAGADVRRRSPAERDVALVFQNFSLYPDWSAKKNIEFPLRAPGRKLDEKTIRDRVDWAADLLHIGHLLDRRANRLSGGEMQRVAIGRAIVRRPRLFLMDEPLSNLDAKLRELLRVELVNLRRQLGTPMIYVTHDQAEALSMGDRVVVLAGGRVLQTGTPAQIYERPDSPAVAKQVGIPRINIVAVTRQNGMYATAAGLPLLAVPVSHKVATGMLLGVRPEHVSLQGGEHPATIELVEDTGPAKVAAIWWGGERLHVLMEKNATGRPGDRVFPQLDPARVLFWASE